MPKKVSTTYLVGEAEFTVGGDKVVVPTGKHDMDVLLAHVPAVDRPGYAQLAQSQGVSVVYESKIVAEDSDVVASLNASEATKGPAVPEDAPRGRLTRT